MYCSNLRKRQKHYKMVFYCFKDKRYIISLEECKNCSDFNMKLMSPIRKVSKKKEKVTEDTYKKVFERDKGKCRLKDCSCNGGLELHHIIYRSENKNLINEPSNCIMLCNAHHRLVHSNKHLWQPILFKKVKEN